MPWSPGRRPEGHGFPWPLDNESAMSDPIRSRFEVLDERFRRVRGDDGWSGCTPAAAGPRVPAYFPAGRYLVFSDIPNDRLLRWDETTGAVGVFRQPAGYANGHTVDRRGRLVSCEHGGRQVTRTEPDGSVTVLADRYEGQRLNSPNDVVERADGSIWFTDPAYGIDSDYEGHQAESEIGACHVYRIDPGTGAVAHRGRRLQPPQRAGVHPGRAEAVHQRQRANGISGCSP